MVRGGSGRSGAAWWARPGLLVLFLLPTLAYAGYSVTDRWYQSYLLAEEEGALRVEIGELRQQNLRLQAELLEARSDRFVEAVAREQLVLVKPGDRAIVLVGPAAVATPDAVPTATPTARPDKPAWRRVLGAVLGR